MVVAGDIPAHARPGRRQQAQLRMGEFPAPDENEWSGLQIEEDWQKPHSKLRSRLAGLTEIIFSICVVKSPKRENYFF
jgi:hypothetical protein